MRRLYAAGKGICGQNEFDNPCGNSCEKKCRNYNGTRPICQKDCVNYGACQCRKGYFRNSFGNCVRADKCNAGNFYSYRKPNSTINIINRHTVTMKSRFFRSIIPTFLRWKEPLLRHILNRCSNFKRILMVLTD